VGDLGRFAFEPVLNLLNGRPVGMEVLRRQVRDQAHRVAASAVWGARQLAEFDSGIAVAAVLHGTDYDATVPLHVDVLADTVVAARRRVRELRTVLQRRDPHRPAPPVLLEIGPAVSAAHPDALADGLAELRDDGFLLAFDGVGRGFGIDLVAELRPDLVKIDAHLVARLPGCPRARAVVTALADVCRAVAVRVSALGVRTPDQLAAVRDHGIPWAQGPLLAEPRRRPSTSGVVLPPELLPQAGRPARPGAPPVAAQARVTVGALAQAPVCLPEDVPAEAVRLALADHPQAGSVVLLDAYRRPTGFLDRNRFMLAISGPFGRALFAQRPARSLADPPRTVPAAADLRTAVAACLDGDRSRAHDDLVLLDAEGSCVGIVHAGDLLQRAAAAAA
jgi:EAL domain-containing protein (putative c-di-GMP-specific phosphodiesterase class I)